MPRRTFVGGMLHSTPSFVAAARILAPRVPLLASSSCFPKPQLGLLALGWHRRVPCSVDTPDFPGGNGALDTHFFHQMCSAACKDPLSLEFKTQRLIRLWS